MLSTRCCFFFFEFLRFIFFWFTDKSAMNGNHFYAVNQRGRCYQRRCSTFLKWMKFYSLLGLFLLFCFANQTHAYTNHATVHSSHTQFDAVTATMTINLSIRVFILLCFHFVFFVLLHFSFHFVEALSLKRFLESPIKCGMWFCDSRREKSISMIFGSNEFRHKNW